MNGAARTRILIRAAFELVALLVLLVGAPLALAITVGWPLPTRAVDLGQLRWELTNGEIPTETWIKVLACGLWASWAQLAVATIAELVGIARGTLVHLPGTFGWAQRVAGRLTTIVAILTTAVPTHPVGAIPLRDLTAPTIIVGTTSAAEPAATAVAPASGTYVTQPLDSLWSIAVQHLGDGNRWAEVRDLNAGRPMPDVGALRSDFTTIRPGWTLLIPDSTTASRGEPPTRQVAPGDSFWTIAQGELETCGNSDDPAEVGGYWRQLVDLNRERLGSPYDPNIIRPGETYVLPALVCDEANVPAQDLAPPVASTPSDAEGSSPASNAPATTSAPPTSLAPKATTTVPTTTAAPPTTTAAELSASSAPTIVGASTTLARSDAEAGDNTGESPSTVLTGIAGCATLAGSAVLALRAMRARQRRHRQPGVTPVPRPSAAAYVETTLRSIADEDRTAWLDAALRFLSASLADDPRPPCIVAVRTTALGVVLLLDEPHPAPKGVRQGDNPSVWHLDTALSIDEMNERAGDAYPYTPALLTVGYVEQEEILLDLETIDVLQVHGENASAQAFLRAAARSASLSPWGSMIDVVTIGITPPAGSRVHAPTDPAAWVATALNIAQANTGRAEPAHAHRTRPGADPQYPILVVVGPGHDELAGRIADATAFAESPFKLITATDVAADHRLYLSASSAILEPLGLEITPAVLTGEEAASLDSLVEHATDQAAEPLHLAAVDAAPLYTMPLGAPSPETLAAIEKLSTPGPVELRILGRRLDIVGAEGEGPNSKVLAAAALIAYKRSVSSEELRASLWPDATPRTIANKMARVRKLLGVTAEGLSRLSDATNSHVYCVHDEVTLDWHRCHALIQRAERGSDADIAACLRAALDMVTGTPLVDAPAPNVSWLLDDPDEYACIDAVIVDAADRLAALALRVGDLELARSAVERGLLASPRQAALERMRERIGRRAASHPGAADSCPDKT